jgi:hypothetical protein
MITLQLDEQEHQAVIEVLEREIPNLRHEIHHTDDRDYRDFLKERERVLEKLLDTVRAQTPATARSAATTENQAYYI